MKDTAHPATTIAPIKIGAALDIEGLEAHHDWLWESARDLELQDFVSADVFRTGWREVVDRARAALDGFQGRLGIHGPFQGLDIANPDPDVAEVVSRRHAEAVAAAAALGARQVVIHSPFDNWHQFNRHTPSKGVSLMERTTEDARRLLSPALASAREHGVTLVVENIKDVTPDIRRELVERIGSPALALSIDTGHAHIAARASGAPPVDVFVRDAGRFLRHVHLQDGDGYADRHWAPGEGSIDWPEVFRALSEIEGEPPHLVLELRRHDEVPRAFEHLRGLGLAA